MEKQDLINFKKWFESYTEKLFSPLSHEDKHAFYFRLQHTQRVRKTILQLAASNQLETRQILLAETIALFHDIGRFPQWTMWKTFNDSVSANHGALGAAILQDAKILGKMTPEERAIILTAVENHNSISVPSSITAEEEFFLKLIRDADRLDVFQLHATHRSGENPFLDRIITGDLAPSSGVSDKIIDQLLAGKMPSKRHAKTLNDYKLMILGWVFDFSFSVCHQIVIDNSIVDAVLKTLPSSEKMNQLRNHLLNHLRRCAVETIPISLPQLRVTPAG